MWRSFDCVWLKQQQQQQLWLCPTCLVLPCMLRLAAMDCIVHSHVWSRSFCFFCRVTLALGCSISSACALGEMHMSSERSLTSRFSSGIIRVAKPGQDQANPVQAGRRVKLLPQEAVRLVDSSAGERKCCLASSCMSTPRHFWCSHKRITTTTVRCSKTSQPDCITPQTQAGRDTAPHLNQDENVQHGADSKENLLPANQKDYFIMPHMNGNEADPSSRSLSLPLSPLQMQRFSLALCLPASISYIFREVQRSSIFCQCRTPIIPHCWVETTHTWLLKYGRGWICCVFCFLFRWLIDFSFFFFPETNMGRNKDNFFKSVLLSLSEIPPPFLQILAVIKSH